MRRETPDAHGEPTQTEMEVSTSDAHVCVVCRKQGSEGGEMGREKREMAGKESSNSTKLRHYGAFVIAPLLCVRSLAAE